VTSLAKGFMYRWSKTNNTKIARDLCLWVSEASGKQKATHTDAMHTGISYSTMIISSVLLLDWLCKYAIDGQLSLTW